MNSPSIRDAVPPDTIPATARDARARAWAFASYRKKKGSRPGAPEDAERRSDEIGANTSIPDGP